MLTIFLKKVLKCYYECAKNITSILLAAVQNTQDDLTREKHAIKVINNHSLKGPSALQLVQYAFQLFSHCN